MDVEISPDVVEQTQHRRFIFIYDTYVIVEADTKEEADTALLNVEKAIEVAGGFLSVFEAWGQEDTRTGDTIRAVL